MLEKKFYKNGQAVYDYDGKILTYYYKNGKIKAAGPFMNNMMEGEWMFYRETGELWQVANFKSNMKHGLWVRYNRNGDEEYRETFENNKQLRK